MLRLNFPSAPKYQQVRNIQIQPMLRLNRTTQEQLEAIDADSNTTNVKVKHRKKKLLKSAAMHSNTTNVKVKHIVHTEKVWRWWKFKYNQC